MTNENLPPFLRLFIAISVPPELRAEIGRVQAKLRRHSPPGVISWARLEQFHITLKYLGDVPVAHVSEMQECVSLACSGFPVLRLSARGVGFFPSAHKPRVVWVGAEDLGGQLARLHRRIDEAMRPFAPAERSRPFTGHITLGRFKPGRHASIKALMQRAAVLHNFHFGDWLAEEVVIVRSELTSAGAIHSPLKSFSLLR